MNLLFSTNLHMYLLHILIAIIYYCIWTGNVPDTSSIMDGECSSSSDLDWRLQLSPSQTSFDESGVLETPVNNQPSMFRRCSSPCHGDIQDVEEVLLDAANKQELDGSSCSLSPIRVIGKDPALNHDPNKTRATWEEISNPNVTLSAFGDTSNPNVTVSAYGDTSNLDATVSAFGDTSIPDETLSANGDDDDDDNDGNDQNKTFPGVDKAVEGKLSNRQLVTCENSIAKNNNVEVMTNHEMDPVKQQEGECRQDEQTQEQQTGGEIQELEESHETVNEGQIQETTDQVILHETEKSKEKDGDKELHQENEEGPSMPKRRRYSNYRKPIDVVQTKCCMDCCTNHLSPKDIELCQEEMKRRNESEQLQFIMSQIRSHSIIRTHKRHGDNIYNFVIAGKKVCAEAWREAFNVSTRRFKDALTYVRNGYFTKQHRNKGKRRPTTKATNAIGWMRHTFERIGDYMPHKSEIHLPSTWTKKSVYRRMKKNLTDLGARPESIVSESHFHTLWSQHLPEFVIVKGRREFTVCSTCAELDEQFHRAKTTKEQDEVIILRRDHDDKVSKERDAYHKQRLEAQLNPAMYTTMIVDGMDQSKTHMPRMVNDKDLASLNRLQVHLTGVLLHTDAAEGKIPLIYTDVKQVPHDSNLTMNIILQTLLKHKDKLGRVLFLQLDNCFRENKNKYLLSLASLLVELNVFEKVLVHFLPVGHTHEDVDQMFSRISSAMNARNDIYTLVDMVSVIEKSYTPSITVYDATPLFNIKDWLIPHLSGQFRNHTKPLWFRFLKNRDGITTMHYKLWADDVWLPEDTDGESGGLKCLKTMPDVQTPPEWVVPSLLKLDVEGLQKDLPSSYGTRMPSEARDWWKNYISNLDNLANVPEEPDTWPLAQLANNLSPEPPVWEPTPEIDRLREKIQGYCPAVTIGTQGVVNLRAAETVDDYSLLRVGDFAVVNLNEEEESEPPYIGKVLEVKEEEVKLHWMKGGYQNIWKEWYNGGPRNRVAYCDNIPKQSILLFGFKLTRKGKLPKETILTIKAAYEDN